VIKVLRFMMWASVVMLGVTALALMAGFDPKEPGIWPRYKLLSMPLFNAVLFYLAAYWVEREAEE
jgi:hypothetical protein